MRGSLTGCRLSLALICIAPAVAVLRAHALFADHVVLQTTDDGGPGARLTGTAEPYEEITLHAAASAIPALSFSGVADALGKWEVVVMLPSGGPYALTLSGNASEEVLTARDALIGDVYLCSGQSNMVFAVGAGNDYRDGVGAQSIENATAELHAAQYNGDMRLWMVPSPPAVASRANLRDGANLLRHNTSRYALRHGRSTYVGLGGGALTNLTGSCNTTALCHDEGSPATEGCDNECFADDLAALTHSWTPVSSESVGAFSAVCYLAARDIRALQAAQNARQAPRPVGLIASYVGGTPVSCWTSDHDADAACGVVKSAAANYPCDPTQACCPGKLFDDKVAPLTSFNIRAVLFYQGEANTDEGYTRSRIEYACQMRLLIDTWRSAWGYELPFFWMQLHGWGSGGRADQQSCMGGDWSNGRDLNCQFAVRLGQAAVAADRGLAGTVGLASAVDACEADHGGDTCNLHPGWKSTPAARLAAEVVRVLFPAAAKAHAITSAPTLATGGLSLKVAPGGGAVTATAAVTSVTPLRLQPIHDWKKIFDGVGCDGTYLVALNATLDDGARTAWINGTLLLGGMNSSAGGAGEQALVMTWKAPYVDSDGNLLGSNITAVQGVAYLPMAVATCVVANAAGQPLSPFLSPAQWPPLPTA